MAKNKLLLTLTLTPEVQAAAELEFAVTKVDSASPARIVELANQHQVEAILLAMGLRLSASDIAALPESVKIVATCSVGYDHLDVKALRARGIAATNTPDVVTAATADLTMLLLLGAARRLKEHAAIVAKG